MNKLGFVIFLGMFLSGLLVMVLIFVSQKFLGESFSPFECGFVSIFEMRNSVSIQFFIITLIFLVFDVELIFLFPSIFFLSKNNSTEGVLLLFLFFILLSLSVVYEWMNGLLNWAKF